MGENDVFLTFFCLIFGAQVASVVWANAKIAETTVDARRRFPPMTLGGFAKIEEKAAIPEPRAARPTKAQMHFRESTKKKISPGKSIF